MAVNTLTQPGGFVPDGQVNQTADHAGGTLESPVAVGGTKHKAAPHLQPAAK